MTFRWGVIGTGPVSRKFVLGLRRLGGVSVTRVASGRRRNAEAFARAFSIPGVAADAEEMAGCTDVDAVYIATPPTLHAAHALPCMAAGKAVLVEKPFAVSSADAEAMAAASARHGVFCMEGMWTRFLPLLDEVRTCLAAGAIGAVRSFSGGFCAPEEPDAGRNLFRADAGGGAMLHRGIYPLSLACHLLGPPVAQEGLAALGETGVDEESVLVLRHEGGAVSTIRASLRSAGPNDCLIGGSEGMLHIHAPVYRPFRMTLIRVPDRAADSAGGIPHPVSRAEALKEGGLLQGAHQRLSSVAAVLRGRRSQGVLRAYAGNGYHYEAAEVMAGVRSGERESRIMPLAESLMLVAVMERARAGWQAAGQAPADRPSAGAPR
jgi:predicted dehydrogenase